MPKVIVGGKAENRQSDQVSLEEAIQGKAPQIIEDKKRPTEKPKLEQPKEVRDLVHKAEAETAKAMEPEEKEETGLEPGDEDLAERAQQRIAKKHREMKQADALAKKLRSELDETEEFSKAQYRRAQAAEEEATRLKAELAKLQAPPQGEPGKIQPPDENDPKFRNEKGEFQLKVYEKARDEYVKAQIREELKAEAAEAEWQSKLRAFEARLEKAREEHPDYNEVLGAQDVQLQPYIQRFMVDSDLGAEIGYYFGKNPDELKRIQLLHPIRGSAELGKLEAKLEAAKDKPKVEPTVTPKPQITPPAPITPLTGNSGGVNDDPSKMTPAQLKQYTIERAIAKKMAKHGR